MGKMPLGDEDARTGGRMGQKSGSELKQLVIREGMEEGFEENDGLAEAGVQVVVGGIQEVPFALGKEAIGVVDFRCGRGESFVEIFDELEEGGNFVEELRALAEKEAAANAIEAGGAATPGMLEIIRIEGREMGRDTEVLGVGVHRAQ
ncbi:MAG TPA: hypothetical protein VJX70_05635 [Candidatus Acidoferrum sp.]|nr:hypothetical protein [Candidatus Acidoferrum sp.]